MDEDAELVAVLSRQTEHVGDHPDGDVLGVLGRRVDLVVACGLDLGDELAAGLTRGRLPFVDRLG